MAKRPPRAKKPTQSADTVLSVATPEAVPYGQQLIDSFPFFLGELWTTVGLKAPSRVQYDIGDWLQNGPRRRVVKGFRGVSKTWITLAYVCWRLRRNPNERVLIVSESLKHARQSLHMLRQWIGQVPFLMDLAPAPLTDARDSADMFDVTGAKPDRVASVTAMGITGQITGSRASIIIADDIETLENSITIEQRARIRDRVTEFDSILLPEGHVIYLGTPHHEESLYDYLPDCGYAVRTWPARYPKYPEQKVRYLAPVLQMDMDSGKRKPADPTWPERFSDEDLQERELSQKTRFQMQYMLVSGLADDLRHPLKLSDLIVFSVNRDIAPDSIAWGTHGPNGSTAVQDIPSVGFGSDRFYSPIMVSDKWHAYAGKKAFLDPAGAGDDKIALAIAGQHHGYLYVPYVEGRPGGTKSDNLIHFAMALKSHRASELYIETNFGGEMLIQLMKPILSRLFDKDWVCNILPVHQTMQKEVRICETLEPVMNQHRLIVDPSVAKNQSLMYQLTHLTKQRGSLEHDDELDALAGVVKQFSGMLAQDHEVMSKTVQQEDAMAAVREWQAREDERSPQIANWRTH